MTSYFPSGLTLNQAIELQNDLAQHIITDDVLPQELKLIGGVMLHSKLNYVVVSAVILNASPDLQKFQVIDKQIVKEEVSFPALAGFESFREGKTIFNIFSGFQKPDLLMVYGHGTAHPRKCGLASHLGLALNIPTIGVARELISGKVKSSSGKRYVVENDDIVGEEIMAGPIKIYVSPGHKISLETAVEISKKTVKTNLPEPLKIAQNYLLDKLRSTPMY